MAAGVKEVESVEEFNKLLSDGASQLVVAHFAAPWAPQCQQMTDVMSELSKDSQIKQVTFLQLEAEKLAEISEKNNIVAVPTFIFFRSGRSIDRLDGANAADLTKKVRHLASGGLAPAPPPPAQKQDLDSRLKQLINRAPVMLFMKGNAQEPKCGFSRTMIGILNDKNISYSTFDILSDEEVRQGLKTYSNWPTYPQLYSNGELLGGLDIVKELVETGELESQLPVKIKLEDRCLEDINTVSPEDENASLSMCCVDAESQAKQQPPFVIELNDFTLEGYEVTINDIGGDSSAEDEEEEGGNDEERDEDLPLWFGVDPPNVNNIPGRGRGRARVRGRKRKKSYNQRRKEAKYHAREKNSIMRSNPLLYEESKEKNRLRQQMTRKREALIMSLDVSPNMSIAEAHRITLQQQRDAGVPEEDLVSLHIGKGSFTMIGELKCKIEGNQRRKEAKYHTREKNSIMRSNPLLYEESKEKNRLRQQMTRKREALIMSLDVSPNMSIAEAHCITLQQQRDAGVPEEDLVSLHIGKGNLTTIGELKRKIEDRRVVDRERMRSKRASLDKNVHEDIKRTSRERMREKRAMFKQFNPDEAAAYRERERTRKRIERRRNSLLLSMPTEAIIPEDGGDIMVPFMPFPVTTEFNSAVKTLKEDLLRKREIDRDRVRRKRAEIREHHPDLAAVIRERERVQKKISRKRNSLLLQMSQDELFQATQTIMHQDSASDPEATQGGVDFMNQEELMSRIWSAESSETSNSCPGISTDPLDNRMNINDSELASHIDNLQKDLQHKKDSNKERMRKKRAKIKEDPDAFEAMKEKERVRKKMERLSRKGASLLDSLNTPVMFSYDVPKTSATATTTLSDYQNSSGHLHHDLENELHIKQEPMDSDEECSGLNVNQNCDVVQESTSENQNMEISMPSFNEKDNSDTNELRLGFDKCERNNGARTVNKHHVSNHDNKKNPSVKQTVQCDSDEDLCPTSSNNGNFEVPHVQNHGNSDVNDLDIPAFSSVDEERNWFQTQLCKLQTRVTDQTEEKDPEFDNLHNASSSSSLTSPNQTLDLSSIGSPNKMLDLGLPAPFHHVQHKGIGFSPIGYKPIHDFVQLPGVPHLNHSNDCLADIAEVSIRNSLEKVTALAGPDGVQNKLKEMYELAKRSREKANEQARRRRQKLRKDPNMKLKYEEIKAKDLERKRQQRAKEAEIRSVFPAYNADKRLKERERKKITRMRMREEKLGLSPTSDTTPQDQDTTNLFTPSMNALGSILPNPLTSSSSSAPPMPTMAPNEHQLPMFPAHPLMLQGLPVHPGLAMYNNFGMGPGLGLTSPFIPQLRSPNPPTSLQSDVNKSQIPHNQSLTS